MYHCDRCNLYTDNLYRYENELLCKDCILKLSDKELEEKKEER